MLWIYTLSTILYWTDARIIRDQFTHDTIPDNKHRQVVEEKELWLEDFTDDKNDYMYEMQSDGAGESFLEDDSSCPPPPKNVPAFGCEVDVCKSDKECTTTGHRCCFNGCAFTCMPTMPPPPIVDWRKEPPRRLRSGNSWLVPGPDDNETEESCSTNDIMDDEDVLLCPHGYICHIEDPGNPSLGIPNRGTCIKERSQTQTHTGRRFRLKNFSLQKGVCVFENAIFVDGATFLYERHRCTCKDGGITCAVGRPNTKRRGT